MSYNDNPNRWWENYLVRYFMPSIAGMAIVSWLASVDPELKRILFMGSEREANNMTLILLVLYGNLFCYVASYPILVFHATRVIDFPKARWVPGFTDGYTISMLLGLGVLAIMLFMPPRGCGQLSVAIGLLLLFSAGQFVRVWQALKTKKITGLHEPVASTAYGYAFALAKQRATNKEIVKTVDKNNEEKNEKLQTTTRQSGWRRETIDTYRHLREHGNSAFIFCLEIFLAALCYIVLSQSELSSASKTGWLAILLVVWSVPAVSAHLIGQMFERRFSKFDRRVNEE